MVRHVLAGAGLVLCAAHPARAADRHVPAGGDFQAALDAARPGDTILLAPGATYVGHFRLPAHGGTTYVTVRSAAPDTALPAKGARINPDHAPHLPKIKSPDGRPAIATAPGAAFWRLMFLELQATRRGQGDILSLGDGSAGQASLAQVPHDLVVDRVYIHGDPLHGQKRGIALNSGRTTITGSHVVDIKAIGQDSQAIAGWNGPGPYLIENNYLEAAGEVLMLGGGDPSIRDLVPSDVIVRGNTLTRPAAWREPIVPAPANVRASAGTDGSLPAGRYAYRVVARRAVYDAVAVSAPSVEVVVTVGDGGRARLQWDPVPGVTEYRIYGRAPGTPQGFWIVNGTTFTDAGDPWTAGAMPRSGTVWQVKNLLELKNARRVQIDGNLLERNWVQAQSGVAVLFTPRNQDGGCSWCVVEDVAFEGNILRGAAGAFNILGRDDEHPSRQTRGIRIAHNHISDIGTSWGAPGYFLQINGEPRDIVVDHNTMVSSEAAGIISVEGPPVRGFVFTNNVARHNRYGIIGRNHGPGRDTIAAYFPGGVFTHNVLAGAPADRYPDENEFPATDDFEARVEADDRGRFTLSGETRWRGAGTDGQDLGASSPP